MTTTETKDAPSSLAAALAELQTRLPRIAKDLTAKVETKSGGSYRYNYADLAQVSREVLPLLGKLGLSFTARPTMVDGRFVLAYKLLHVSGEHEAGEYPLRSPDRDTPQEIGSAITYARRYCLCAVTGVAPDDDDNDAIVAERAAARRSRRESRGQQSTHAGEPGITGEQMREIQTLFRESEVVDSTAKLRYAATVVKRELGSSTELTRTEADNVIKALRRAAERRAAKKPAADPSDATSPTEPGEVDAEAWLDSQQPPGGDPS